MKKRTLVMTCCLLSVMLSACGKTEKTIDSEKVPKDKVVNTEYFFDEENQVEAEFSKVCSKSELIILGEVKKITYTVREYGKVCSELTLEVKEHLKGDVQNKQIIVEEKQGYATIADYLNSFKEKQAIEMLGEPYRQYTKKDKKNNYIISLPENDMITETGDIGVYFLEPSQYGWKKDSFSRVFGGNGEYRMGEEEQFFNVNNKALKVSEQTFSYEELKSEILKNTDSQ